MARTSFRKHDESIIQIVLASDFNDALGHVVALGSVRREESLRVCHLACHREVRVVESALFG